MTEFEEKILKYMSHGLTIKVVSDKLKSENYEPSSQSMVKKTIQKFKKDFGLKTTFQLGYYIGQLQDKIKK